MGAAAAFTVTALILYPAAMSLPVMEVSRLGHVREATIWSGTVSLLASGEVVVGLVVLACSIVAPLAKLGAMLGLTVGSAWWGRRPRAVTFRLVEWIGRWGMLDVLLVALLVAAVKLGEWVEVRAGPGAVAFAGVVVCSLLASAFFDPHAIWEQAERRERAR